jgi:hypothetical protein
MKNATPAQMRMGFRKSGLILKPGSSPSINRLSGETIHHRIVIVSRSPAIYQECP